MGDAATGTTGDVEAALAVVTAGLPGGGEPRPGQVAMATAVGRAIEGRRHLVVQAGTGTGKSLAYLVPAVLSGRTVVVATATKALQDQLAGKDIPLVAEALGDVDFTAALLKGRSNYLCRQRAAEIGGRGEQLSITTEAGAAGLTDAGDELPPPVPEDRGSLGDQVRRLLTWAGTSSTGDRAELEFEPTPAPGPWCR